MKKEDKVKCPVCGSTETTVNTFKTLNKTGDKEIEEKQVECHTCKSRKVI